MSDDESRGRTAKPRGLSEVMKDAARIAEAAGTTVRDLAESVVASALEIAGTAAETGRERATSAVQQLRGAVERASSAARDLGQQARRVVELLERAPEDAADPDRLVARLVEGIEVVRGQLDSAAQGFLIGYLGEGGVGLQRVAGLEIAYLREAAVLRVARVEGRCARLAAGVATSAYAGAVYGPSEAIAAPHPRRGADAGVAVAAFSFFSTTSTPRAAGWWVALNAGINIGIPVLSDLGAFEVQLDPIAVISLIPAQVQRVEAAIQGAPDRSWRRGIAQSLL